jgi:hypothetical protein
MKLAKYAATTLFLLLISSGVQQIFFSAAGEKLGSSVSFYLSGFSASSSIVFIFFGTGGILAGCGNLFLKMRKSNDLNMLRSEILDLIAYGANIAVGIIFFSAYLLFR